MFPKNICLIIGILKKAKGRGLTSVVQNYFDKALYCRLILCQVQNADLVAVSLVCLKDPKNLLKK